ncbi:uncharacterized protein LOC111710712 [Eurytemora carolleeae]|uniref:uncharacterized protein LOC111710712 n=1 Tax=Eurytemora carolleeae TaxID=1294199 RepID=UPI000C776AFF|nr:uncharacterized protein LOC111710712 [Eurytemora carolleeae]|eukprot:XP_023340597.1 uncharacterized protein LOC111710712 [Eurytemora affinis]
MPALSNNNNLGGVYVYVIGGRLTPLHPDKIPPLSNLENFPCIAAHTDSEDSLAQITCKIKSLPRNLGLELAWGLPAKGLELLTMDHPDVLFTDRYSIEEEYIEDIVDIV